MLITSAEQCRARTGHAAGHRGTNRWQQAEAACGCLTHSLASQKVSGRANATGSSVLRRQSGLVPVAAIVLSNCRPCQRVEAAGNFLVVTCKKAHEFSVVLQVQRHFKGEEWKIPRKNNNSRDAQKTNKISWIILGCRRGCQSF